MPLEYKYTTLNDDGEYVQIKSTFTGYCVGLGVGVIVFGSLLALGIFLANKYTKVNQPKKAEATTSSTETTAPKAETWICAYCGNTSKLEKNKCSHCGAKKQ